jgi:hypothetical protein
MKKVPKKRLGLGLDREVVATLVSELTTAELRQVAGASGRASAVRSCDTDN